VSCSYHLVAFLALLFSPSNLLKFLATAGTWPPLVLNPYQTCNLKNAAIFFIEKETPRKVTPVKTQRKVKRIVSTPTGLKANTSTPGRLPKSPAIPKKKLVQKTLKKKLFHTEDLSDSDDHVSELEEEEEEVVPPFPSLLSPKKKKAQATLRREVSFNVRDDEDEEMTHRLEHLEQHPESVSQSAQLPVKKAKNPAYPFTFDEMNSLLEWYIQHPMYFDKENDDWKNTELKSSTMYNKSLEFPNCRPVQLYNFFSSSRKIYTDWKNKKSGQQAVAWDTLSREKQMKIEWFQKVNLNAPPRQHSVGGPPMKVS